MYLFNLLRALITYGTYNNGGNIDEKDRSNVCVKTVEFTVICGTHQRRNQTRKKTNAESEFREFVFVRCEAGRRESSFNEKSDRHEPKRLEF